MRPTHSATRSTIVVICTTARYTNKPNGTITAAKAASSVSVADKPVPSRLLSRVYSGENRYAATAATTTRMK